MSEPLQPFVFEIPVRASELDPTGRAAPAAILDYFQEAAGTHAARLGFGYDDMTAAGRFWVLARLRVRFDKLPAWPAVVRVTTWPSGTDGLYGTRDYLAHDADGQRVARGTSDWLVLDAARRRPMRIPADVAALDLPTRDRALPSLSEKLVPPANTDVEGVYPVRRSDLDINRHVNNVRYAEWATATFEPAFLDTHRLVALDLHFRAETTQGDTVRVETGSADGGGSFAHRLTRESDGREVAVARSEWRRMD